MTCAHVKVDYCASHSGCTLVLKTVVLETAQKGSPHGIATGIQRFAKAAAESQSMVRTGQLSGNGPSGRFGLSSGPSKRQRDGRLLAAP